MWLVFLFVYVNFHVMSGTMMMLFEQLCHQCFIDDYPASEISNNIYQVTSKRQRCVDIAFIDRNKEHRLPAGKGQFHSHFRV